MAQNLKLDPKKRDYIFENGSPLPSDRIEEAAFYALMIPKGKWLYGDVDQGSYIHTLQNRKRTGSIEQDFSAFAKDAIERQLISQGKAKEVGVVNAEATRTGTSNQVQIVPNETQLSNQLTFDPV